MLEYCFSDYQDDELLFNYRLKEQHFYSDSMQYIHQLSEEEYWNKMVDSVEFCFSQDVKLLTLGNALNIEYATYLKFQEAINDYIEERTSHKHIKEISSKSAKNFLYLLPTIESYLPNVNIDADTGCINITFATDDNGILSALITGKSEIHYSRVSKGVKIYKFSGVAKIKDSRDLKHFKKVLGML